jgi:hypothetical protein
MTSLQDLYVQIGRSFGRNGFRTFCQPGANFQMIGLVHDPSSGEGRQQTLEVSPSGKQCNGEVIYAASGGMLRSYLHLLQVKSFPQELTCLMVLSGFFAFSLAFWLLLHDKMLFV